MKLLPVMSSSVAGIGWKAYPDNLTNGQMAVQFVQGKWYLYERVDIEVFVAVIMADSIGKAFATFKKYGFAYRETSPEEIARL